MEKEIPAEWTGKKKLRCQHCIGLSCYNYLMYCNILKKMPDGRLKVKVFGNRYWGGYEQSRIRYVEENKVIDAQLKLGDQ